MQTWSCLGGQGRNVGVTSVVLPKLDSGGPGVVRLLPACCSRRGKVSVLLLHLPYLPESLLLRAEMLKLGSNLQSWHSAGRSTSNLGQLLHLHLGLSLFWKDEK